MGDKLLSIVCNNLREVVAEVNARNIKKDDVLDIIKEGEYFILMYYGKD